MRRGIRVRITALATLAVAAVLSLMGVVLVATVRTTLVDGLDDQLRNRAETIETVWAGGDRPVAAEGDPDESFWQIVAGGMAVAGSDNVAGRPPLAPPATTERVVSIELDVLEGPARVLNRPLGSESNDPVLQVGMSLEDIDETMAVLVASLAIGLPIVTALLAIVVWTMVGRTLAPVEAIRAMAAGIDGTDLDRRVPVPDHDDEISQLAITMNEMLERIAVAHSATQRFVADASHELRSPLTRLRSQLEIEADDVDHRALLETVDDMQHLVEDLLLLARMDAGRHPGGATPLDLDEVVRAAISTTEDGRPVTTRLAPVMVAGHERSLRRAIANVIANGRRHAATAVRVTLSTEDGYAVIAVEDDGPGIPAELQPAIFDRFVRTDEARTRVTGGTGLGLAIAREVLATHGGTISVDMAYTSGARFVLRLPALD